jgi:hypothetical protein
LPRPTRTMTLLLFYASCCHWDDRWAPQSPAFFLVRWSLTNLFNQDGLEHQTYQSVSCVVGIAGTCHCTHH